MLDIQNIKNKYYLNHECTNRPLLDMLGQFKRTKQPIEVNFRELVNWVKYGERASHMIHLYPAKLLPHIPAYFLSNTVLSQPGDTVLDPFCGSGTVPLEANLAERYSIGADSNPLARLITKTKTSTIDATGIEVLLSAIKDIDFSHYSSLDLPKITNPEIWYSNRVLNELGSLKNFLDQETPKNLQNLATITFSNILKKCSYADPSISVPVRLNPDKYELSSDIYNKTIDHLSKIECIDVKGLYIANLQNNLNRLKTLPDNKYTRTATTIYNDARTLKHKDEAQRKEFVDLIITSPPYAGAQKYIRSSSLSLGWLGFCDNHSLRDYERQNIGREHYSTKEYIHIQKTEHPEVDTRVEAFYKKNPLRAHIVSNYIIEMRDSLLACHNALKPGGHMVFVCSANHVLGELFETHKYLSEIAESIGFCKILTLIDHIHSRGLMTKRNKTANIINSEWVYIFRKE